MNYDDIEEICVINIGDEMENIFMFFKDGTVVREYDEGETIRNAVVVIHVRDIETEHRLKILKECPKEHRMKIIDLFNMY
jgi:hypothetical protein